MNAFRLLRAIEAAMKEQMQGDGLCTVAAEPEEAIEALSKQGPKDWGVALVWQGYGGPEDTDYPASQANKISVFVRVPTGLPAVPGDTLHQAVPGNNPSVLERVEWTNLVIRMMRFADASIDKRGLVLKGSNWYRKEDGKTLRIHELQYELVTTLDHPASYLSVKV